MSKLAKLLTHPGLWRGDALAQVRSASVPSGFDRLDRELPGGGWPTGALTEILTSAQGIGEVSLVLPALARLAAEGRWQTWIAPPHQPYAPAITAAGIDLARLIVVRPAPGKDRGREALWALEQTLRMNVCGAVLTWLPATRPAVTYAELRRLQLAAEESEVFVVLFRPQQAEIDPSPAALRLALSPAGGGRLTVHILKRRGLAAEAPVTLDLKRLYALDRHLAPAAPARSVPAGVLLN
jgi:cell division inhibitor SulA/protein ImuA